MLRMFPLLMIVVIIYTVLALGGGATNHADIQRLLTDPLTSLALPSGERWSFNLGDLFILFGLVLLFVEIVKSTRTSARQIIHHGFSMLTFIVALIEFIALKGFATSTFLIIVAMTLFDVVAGYSISIVSAEHDLGLGRERPA